MIIDRCRRKLYRRAATALLGAAFLSSPLLLAQAAETKPQEDILTYIHHSWDRLSRSSTNCASFHDSKVAQQSAILYLPAEFEQPADVTHLQSQCAVEVKTLPIRIHHLGEIRPENIHPSGLLYLPAPYVVPGGRFNEMYGWDSYFILRGLIADGRIEMARNVVENFFFEIDHYGSVLNANRTYYLGRSQPPFLSAMVMALHQANKASGTEDHAWLEHGYQSVKRDYNTWITAPHYDRSTGLSRYADSGSGPVPEIADHSQYYNRVARWFYEHDGLKTHYVTDKKNEGSGNEIWFQQCRGQDCKRVGPIWLTLKFYAGDRAMRESGFDTSFHFGPYGAETEQYVPVCLNSLLYREETDLAAMADELGHKQDQRLWIARAERRKAAMQRYLWDANAGTFSDYNVLTHQRTNSIFSTAYYPLWARLATAEQAAQIRNTLKPLEQAGGIATSNDVTGAQWDKPYGWAPLQLIAVEGLRHYGFTADADRIATKFLHMVATDYARTGLIKEKYDVVAETSDVHIEDGYADNVIGFGWTNGAFTALLQELPEGAKASVLEHK